MSPRPSVAIVGAGASGTLTAAHLAAAAAAAQRHLEILLVDPDVAGRGLAYGTSDSRHRLNVPARGMSAWPDDPQHFARWLRRHVATDLDDNTFAPRVHYARYLTDVLDDALQAAVDVEFAHLRTRVTDLRPHGSRIRLTLADGTSRTVDAAVLALGHGRPGTAWAPAELLSSGRLVADPWRDDVPMSLRRGDEVVLVGAGLTAADMAQSWGREGVRVHIVSRHGMLPLPHAAAPTAPVAGPEILPENLPAARRMVFDAIRAAGGDWRAAVDALRPVTQQLWGRLDDDSRRAFLTGAMRRWDRIRHRIDPALHDWIQQRRAEGSLVVHAGEIRGARDLGAAGVEVSVSDGTVIRAAAVVNCTGTCTPVRSSDDPLLLNLLASRLVQPGPCDLGVATDAAGRVMPATGTPLALWTIGPLRRGELWESTAVPEIRGQAAALGREIVASLPVPSARRRPRDPYGLPLTATDAAAGRYLEGLRRVLRVQSGAERLVQEAVEADPSFALGHATLALLGHEWGAPVDVEQSLLAAEASLARADERERHFVEVATARVREPGPGSAAALLTYLHAYPEDALALSIAVPTIAFGGATEVPAEAWALVEGLGAAYGDDWWYLGMLAFVRQDQDRFAEAAELAGRALVLEPAAGHAVHAKAHVHYETGDHRAGLEWLDRWIDTSGARASHRAHFSWHAALHELALGDGAAVAARFAAQLAPPAVDGVRALVDSASLFWRAGVAGVEIASAREAVLAAVPAELLESPPTPFIALHAAFALAAVDDCRGLVRLRRYAQRQRAEPFGRTIAPLADALTALVHDEPDVAVEGLLELTGVELLGGSAAQREIVTEALLHSATLAGRKELAAGILTDRLARRGSPADRARLQDLTAVPG